MEMVEYIKIIKNKLGSHLLDIELKDDDVKDLIKIAFLELSPYIDTPHFKTIPYNVNGIDLSQERVKSILYIMRGSLSLINSIQNTDALLFNPLSTINAQYSSMNGYSVGSNRSAIMDGYITSLLYQQIRNTVNQDLDFTFDRAEQKLYLFQQNPYSNEVTIVYNKIYSDINEIIDDYWINWMIRLSSAYVKEALGRIRSKYKMTAAPYELDGDTLLSEAQNEFSEIRQFLQANDNLVLPID